LSLHDALPIWNVVVLSEGDPLFYGSYMHLHVRLQSRYRAEVVAGVTAMSGCWSMTGLPLVQGDDILSVLPGTLPEEKLAERLANTDGAVIMKVGRDLPKIRRALASAGKLSEAAYVERGTMANGTAHKLEARLVVTASGRTEMTGTLTVVGLGPGSPDQITPEALAAVAAAEDFFGYFPYIDRLDLREDQRRHASDNREELARARAALELAAK